MFKAFFFRFIRMHLLPEITSLSLGLNWAKKYFTFFEICMGDFIRDSHKNKHIFKSNQRYTFGKWKEGDVYSK